jgi:hypothetical protein
MLPLTNDTTLGTARDCCAAAFQSSLCRLRVRVWSFGDAGSVSGLPEPGESLMWINNWVEFWITVQTEVNGNANAKRSNFLILP